MNPAFHGRDERLQVGLSVTPPGELKMSRVLLPDGGTWYDELKAVGYYGESELEREIRQHVASLFPSFYVFPFKKDVRHRTTRIAKRPDLGMLRHDIAAWGVIEVELSEHDLAHVLEQTSCFAEGDYNAPEMAGYIHRQIGKHCNKSVNLARLGRLIASELPTILVIADAHVEEWQAPLRKVRADLCVFQIFKNTRGHFLYRTFGGYPTVPTREAHCRRHPTIPNTLEVVGGFAFKRLGRKRQVDIVFNATITRWACLDDDGGRYLRFLGKVNPLSPNETYALYADRMERYYFRTN